MVLVDGLCLVGDVQYFCSYSLAVSFEKPVLSCSHVMSCKQHEAPYWKTYGYSHNTADAILAPAKPTSIASLPSTSNVLCVRGTTRSIGSSLFVTFADRSLLEVSASPPYSRLTDVLSLHNGPILSVLPLGEDRVLSTSMSGQLIVHYPRSYGSGTDVHAIERRSDHTKYAVHVAATRSGSEWIVATVGWDQKINLYLTGNIEDDMEDTVYDYGGLGDPSSKILLPSNPESIIFVRHPDTNGLYLIFSRRDSTHLYYYYIDESDPGSIKIHEAGKQNLAPHANAWIAFSPSCLALCPTDPTLLAVATSHLPHMKLIIVRLLFPDSRDDAAAATAARGAPETQSSQARAALALSDREDAAISLHISTLAPQTPYSTPQVVWRPDGCGVWVNGDDGVVRGIEVTTGKVIALLKGHEAGSKVRSLWAGTMRVRKGSLEGRDDSDSGSNDRVEEEEEWLVSGGFDKRIIVWKVGEQHGDVDNH